MKETIIGILGIWALVGFLVIPSVRRPQSRLEAVLQGVLSGPAGWLILVCMILYTAGADLLDRIDDALNELWR